MPQINIPNQTIHTTLPLILALFSRFFVGLLLVCTPIRRDMTSHPEFLVGDSSTVMFSCPDSYLPTHKINMLRGQDHCGCGWSVFGKSLLVFSLSRLSRETAPTSRLPEPLPPISLATYKNKLTNAIGTSPTPGRPLRTSSHFHLPPVGTGASRPHFPPCKIALTLLRSPNNSKPVFHRPADIHR